MYNNTLCACSLPHAHAPHFTCMLNFVLSCGSQNFYFSTVIVGRKGYCMIKFGYNPPSAGYGIHNQK